MPKIYLLRANLLLARHSRRAGQRGVAVVLVMSVLALVLLGTGLMVNLGTQSLRTQGSVAASNRAYYCAEAGLSTGRDFFRLNPNRWSEFISTNYVLTGHASIDGNDSPFSVRLIDNYDEFPPAINNPSVDTDQTVIMVATCNDPQYPIERRQYLTTHAVVGVKHTSFIFTTTDNTKYPLPTYVAGSGLLQGAAELESEAAPDGTTALKLDGTGGGGVLFGDNPVLNGTKSLEVSLWFQAETTQPAYSTLVSKSHGAASDNTGWSVEMDDAGRKIQFAVFTTNAPYGASAWSSVAINDMKWHHLVGRYDGTNLFLYLDGVLQSFAPVTGELLLNQGMLSVGRWEVGPSRFYNGRIASLMIRSFSDTNNFWSLDGGLAVRLGGTTLSSNPTAGTLTFNGTNGRALVPDGPEVNGKKGLEVDFWFNAASAQVDNADVLSKGHGAASNDTGWNVEFSGSTGRLGFGIYAGTTTASVLTQRAVNDDQWHHFHGVYDGRTISVFLDEMLQGRIPASGDIKTNGKPLSIGAWEMGPSRFFNGSLSGLTIHSYSEEVVGFEDGLVVLDSNTSSTVGHDGQTPAILFDGSTSYARIPDSPNWRPLTGPTGIEVSFWFLAEQGQSRYATIMSKGHGAASNYTGWTVDFESSGHLLQFGVYGSGQGGSAFTKDIVDDGRWHHYRGVYDGRFVSLYLDHVLQSRNPVSGTILVNSKPTTIGRWELGPQYPFRGRVDSVRINPLYSPGADTFVVDQQQHMAGYNNQSGSWLMADINGDGHKDMVHLVASNYVDTWMSRGDGQFTVGSFSPAPDYVIQNGDWLVGDLNADGREDLVHLVGNTNYARTWMSNGDGTFNVGWYYPAFGYVITNGSYQIGDFNGDGMADVVHFVSNNGTSDYIHIWTSLGNGQFTLSTFHPGGSNAYVVPNGSFQLGDFNGDGRTDILHLINADYVRPWLARSNGGFDVGYFQPWANYGVQNGRWYPGDFNGDGLTDMVHIVANTNYMHTWYSNGDGSFAVTTFSPANNYDMNNGAFFVGDLNEDNRDDLVHVVYNTNYVHPWLSRGDGTYDVPLFSPSANYVIPNGFFMMGDINKDRKSDLIHIVNSDYIHTWRSKY